MWVNAPLRVADTVLRRLLDLETDIVALQEWPSGRNPLLKASGSFQRLLVEHPDRRIDHQGVLAVRRRDVA